MIFEGRPVVALFAQNCFFYVLLGKIQPEKT
jgi:hypothetical protein